MLTGNYWISLITVRFEDSIWSKVNDLLGIIKRKNIQTAHPTSERIHIK